MKVDDELTCQLYPTIPDGSLTAVHEIVNGSVTLAPSAGETGDGAGGGAATTRPPALTYRITANNSVRYECPNIRNFITPPMIDRMLPVAVKELRR